MRHGDEIRVGQIRLVFRDPLNAVAGQTEAEQEPPSMTTRERDVPSPSAARCSRATCSPSLPPSARFAEELVITQAAVKQHLGR